MFESKEEAAEPLYYNEFWRQERYEDFQSWTRNGIGLHGTGSNVSLLLAPGAATSYTDDAAAGDTFYSGTLTSPIQRPRQPIHSLIASWNASTPAGTWLELQVRIFSNRHWSRWYSLGIWAGKHSTIQRHSVEQQQDEDGSVATDTLQVTAHPAIAYQLRVTLFSTTSGLSPVLWRIYVIASSTGKHRAEPFLSSDEEAWGIDLQVPQRSQMLPSYQEQTAYGRGNAWCSPASVCMLLAYWAEVLQRPDLHQTLPEAAARIYDASYQGTGNWPFTMAYAAEFGLRAYVTRMYSFNQIEKWIQAGIPLAISISYKEHELPNAPIPATPDGHLLVIRGFTENGDVITNDPAAPNDAAVQIIYNRYDLSQAWLNGSHGLVYVVYPENWPVPTGQQQGCW